MQYAMKKADAQKNSNDVQHGTIWRLSLMTHCNTICLQMAASARGHEDWRGSQFAWPISHGQLRGSEVGCPWFANKQCGGGSSMFSFHWIRPVCIENHIRRIQFARTNCWYDWTCMLHNTYLRMKTTRKQPGLRLFSFTDNLTLFVSAVQTYITHRPDNNCRYLVTYIHWAAVWWQQL